jgi:PAP2 superfamily
MRFSHVATRLAIVGATVVAATGAQAQTAANLNALRGLAPVSALGNTDAGKKALAANLTVTAAIQNGTANQPLLLPFPAQQVQALKDAFITGGNAFELADALGTKLGGIYQASTQYTSKTTFSSLSPNIAALIAYTGGITSSDAGSGKFFFSNATTNGKKPISAAAAQIFTQVGGTPDVFGKAYGLVAGTKGSDPYGDSRPFQTEPKTTTYNGADFFGTATTNTAYLIGPIQDLTTNPAFPSGHTTYGYTESLLLALMVPERYQQAITRAAEYGNDRIIVGAHYAMDVLAGRTLAMYDMAQLLSGNPAYLGQTVHGAKPITDYREALKAATADMVTALKTGCGNTIAVCAKEDTSRFSDPAKNEALYEATQTYDLPVVFQNTANSTEDVGKIAPEAGTLLEVAFPSLTLAQADDILTQTEGPGGRFLDNGSAFGLYSRLNLYAAAAKAAALAP